MQAMFERIDEFLLSILFNYISAFFLGIFVLLLVTGIYKIFKELYNINANKSIIFAPNDKTSDNIPDGQTTVQLFKEGTFAALKGNAYNDVRSLNKDETFLGRSIDSDIKINDKSVSLRHAVIVRMKNNLYIMDLNSTNGTILNSKRLRPMRHVRLKDGDIITLGTVPLSLSLFRDAYQNDLYHIFRNKNAKTG